jgi:IS30 family transposase
VLEPARFGDWEADLVIGTGQKQARVTINERVSRYSIIFYVPFKTAQAVGDALITLLKLLAHCVHTRTTDNGKEFAQHKRIASALSVDFFSPIPTPRGSKAHGANENMNGLIP